MLVSMSYVTKLPPQQMLAIQARGNLISTLGVTLPQPAACCVWICGIKSTSKHYVHLSELERTGRRYTCPNKALSPNTSASQTADNMYTSIFQDDWVASADFREGRQVPDQLVERAQCLRRDNIYKLTTKQVTHRNNSMCLPDTTSPLPLE